MYKLFSKKGNYFIGADSPEGVTIQVKSKVSEQMTDSETTDVQRIQRSLEKWEFNESLLGMGIKVYNDGGRGTCALCMRYNNWQTTTACMDCPIYNYTGKRGCEDTPYDRYIRADEDDVDQCLELATEEVGFLKEVLAQAKDAEAESPF